MVKTLFVFVVATLLAGFKPDKPLKVIFLGDSITQGGAEAGGFIRLLENMLAEKGFGADYELVGKGIGGNMVRHLLARFEEDVIAEKPDLVFLSVGINDVGFFTWHPQIGGTPIDQYELGLRYMVKRMQQKNIKVVLCTPTVIEERHDGTNPMDQELDKFAAVVRRLAQDLQVGLCDLRSSFISYLNIYNQDNKLKGTLTTDYVHMNETGNKLIAETMLPALLHQSSR